VRLPHSSVLKTVVSSNVGTYEVFDGNHAPFPIDQLSLWRHVRPLRDKKSSERQVEQPQTFTTILLRSTMTARSSMTVCPASERSFKTLRSSKGAPGATLARNRTSVDHTTASSDRCSMSAEPILHTDSCCPRRSMSRLRRIWGTSISKGGLAGSRSAKYSVRHQVH
jgi:hypothetical protein